MSTHGQSYNFLGAPSSQMGGWGGTNSSNDGWGGLASMGAGGGMPDWNAQMQTMLAQGDIQGALAIQNRMDSQSNNADILGKLDGMNQKPSPWATGAQTFGQIAQGLGSLGSMYLGYQQMKGQKKAFEFNKGVMNTNLSNSIADYNRRLGDTLSNRALNNGQGQGWVSSELAKHSAKRSQ